jgi:hypothetical protein
MIPDHGHPETLLTVSSEVEAAAIATALAEYDINAFAAGGYTSGFKAEAPSSVAVLVKHADFDRARLVLAMIRQQQCEIDWSKVNVMEGAETEPHAAETAGDAPAERSLRFSFSWGLSTLGIFICVALITFVVFVLLGGSIVFLLKFVSLFFSRGGLH